MNLIYTQKVNKIQLKNYADEVIIWFFGDVHRDATCDVDRWHKFLEQSAKDDAYYFGMGDYHDFASGSEQKKLEDAHLHETTVKTFDDMVESKNREFCKEIKHMRGRLLGMIEGNHSWHLQSGKTSTEDLADRMDTQYLGWLCHYTITFSANSKSLGFHIVLCHGRAGGKTYGITVNQVGDLKTIFPVADIYCMGHDHQRWADCISVLIPTISGGNGWKIKQKEQLLCRSGSFKKSYEPGVAGFEARKLLKPANLGALKVIIRLNRVRNDGTDTFHPEINAVV